MKIQTTSLAISLLICSGIFSGSCKVKVPPTWEWEIVEAIGEPTARHEAGLVGLNDKLYLIGGRRINPTSVFDTQTNTWTEQSKPPLEIHHFQPVVFNNAIYIIGAMTGGWPNEKPLERVLIYYPEEDRFEYSHEIPEHRRRGGAGLVVHQNKLYMVGGITNGHMDGYKPWFDEYDPQTGAWKTLDDAPSSRDHFQAAMAGDKLYTFAGRNSSRRTSEDMSLTIEHGNVYDFATGKWEQVTHNLAIPTQRAGNAVFVWNNEILVGGGESPAHVVAHNEIEAFHTDFHTWRQWPALNRGRHGTGFVVMNDQVYTASGCGNRGGEPELTSIERLRLPTTGAERPLQEPDKTPVYQQWEIIDLSFEGPQTSEDAEDNPFLNFRLDVTFTHAASTYTVRGFYAADGNAAESSASSGNIWQVRFTPDVEGEWSYTAEFTKGNEIALDENASRGERVDIQNSTGKFLVIRSDIHGKDFRSNGKLGIENGYFKFKETDSYWMKCGANSPENFLAFEGFDDTYRIKAKSKEGEATAPETIHSFTPHMDDWKTGDPTWKDAKGKGIIGAINYLSSMGMNAVYFLTLNILGDGKDVWPYMTPNEFTRFDVSKLEQWEIVFQYMQSKGILLHMVLQETENETMLDGGDTGRLRKLYFNEMIARFGHHLGLVWNLGEENGPAPWAPEGQNDAQRKAMASYLKRNDPYTHPVLLHTHSYDPLRTEVLNPILGFEDLDGLSLQANIREGAAEVVQHWKDHAKKSGQEWLITMDEIGEWHTAVLPDELDPDHPTIRKYALWGTLLSGAAGVEWYFGARYPHNDLSSEDWRQRHRLWELTHFAKSFFEKYLPYWEMSPMHSLINADDSFCFQKPGEVYAIYTSSISDLELDLTGVSGSFEVHWFNPIQGGVLDVGSVQMIEGGGMSSLGIPRLTDLNKAVQDWVVLVRNVKE